MDEYMGMIKIFAGNFAPKNWAFCQGQTLAISTNQALFSLLGTMYGGDGITTFKLPNYQGLIPVGMGLSPYSGTNYVEAEIGGKAGIGLTAVNLPPHVHTLTGGLVMQGNSDSADTTDPTGGFPGPSTAASYAATGTEPMGALSNNLALGSAGGGAPYDNRMPFLGMNYIICLYGLYPSRN